MLKACAECGHEISTQALACPHCGNRPVNSCESCFEHHLSLAKSPNRPCRSPHGVCPAFVDYMAGPIAELAAARATKSHSSVLTSL